LVAPVHQGEVAGNRCKIEGPVERRVTTADDEQALVAERLHLAYRVKHRRAFIGLDTGHRGALRLKRAAARCHHDELGLEHLALIGGDTKLRIADALDRLHHLPEMKGRFERLDLLHERVRQPLARHHRQGRNVVDRLFGIEFGALAADLVKDVDEMRLDVEQAEFKYGKKTAGAGANDEYGSLDRIGDAWVLRPGNDETEGQGSSLGRTLGKERLWPQNASVTGLEA